MRPNRSLSCLAAIGIASAAVLLPAVLAAARADDLSDLRGAQQPVPPRLDQPVPPATQAPSAATASPELPPTIGSFPRSFVIPGTETSVTISGSVQTNVGVGSGR
jgi:hypothetical protein